MLHALVGLAALTAAPLPAPLTDAPKDGVELIGLMRERYAGKWYRTLTFVQKTTLADGKVETWYEAAELPGKLRIDIARWRGRTRCCSGTTRSTSSRPASSPNRLP